MIRWHERLWAFTAVVLVALLAAACGSTTQTRSSRRTPTAGRGEAGPLDTVQGAGDERPRDGRASAGTDGAVTQRSDDGASTTGGSREPTASLASGVSGRGFDAEHIYVGVTMANDTSEAAKVAGYDGIDPGDVEANTNAVIAQINRAGGVFGRSLVPRFHDSRTADLTARPADEAQAVCTRFTQDAPVVVVVNTLPALDDDPFYSCMSRARTPVVSTGPRIVDGHVFATYRPHLYTVAAANWDRFAPTFVSRLQQLGYFARWDTTTGASGDAPLKLGLLYGNATSNTRVFDALAAILAQRGYGRAETYAYDMSNAGNAFATTGNAVLRFRSAGVTHVIVDEGVLAVFATAAEDQGYRPRYGVQTVMYPAAAADSMPARQLAGMLGAGWTPTADVHDPSSTGAAQDSCLAAIREAGRDYRGNSWATRTALGVCDGVRVASAAFASGGGLTSTHLSEGFARVASTFRSALTFSGGAAHRDPTIVGAVRDVGFDQSCACIRYLSTTDHRF